MIVILIVGTYLTSLISGVFGVAGGVVLMGLYSLFLPVTTAMMLHGVAQAFSNGFRTWFFREHIIWAILPRYSIGAFVALGVCFWISYIPSKQFVFLLLGAVAVSSVVMPGLKSLNIEKRRTAIMCGFVVTFMQIFSGVSGPLLDIFYLKNKMNRYQIIASKSLTQTLGHVLKLVYYGSLMWVSLQEDFILPYWILPAVILMTLIGTRSGKFLVGYINDTQFRKATTFIILLLGLFYLYKGMDEGGYLGHLY